MAKSIQFTRIDTLHAALGVIPGFLLICFGYVMPGITIAIGLLPTSLLGIAPSRKLQSLSWSHVAIAIIRFSNMFTTYIECEEDCTRDAVVPHDNQRQMVLWEQLQHFLLLTDSHDGEHVVFSFPGSNTWTHRCTYYPGPSLMSLAGAIPSVRSEDQRALGA